jgi:hypothetical protein
MLPASIMPERRRGANSMRDPGGPRAARSDETQALEFWSDFSSFIAW